MEVKTPSVSIILPFFNAPYLSESIESILGQTYHDLELILIDNASTDKSAEVAEFYATKEPRVRLIKENTRGVMYAANAGIRAAKGRFIARMDADDFSFPERIEIQVKELEENQDLQVVSGLVEYSGDSQNEGFITYVNWLNSINTEDEIRLNQFVEFPIANPSMMFRREVFERYGYYEDGDYPEDYEYFLRLQSHGVKMKKVEELVIKWRDTENRLTRTDERYSQEAFFRIKAKYLSQWLKQHNEHHPHIVVWGAGRVSRRRSDFLLEYGIEISSYIDVKPGVNILHYENIPDPSTCFIISYVSNRGIRDEIRSFLVKRGFTEGVNFIIAA